MIDDYERFNCLATPDQQKTTPDREENIDGRLDGKTMKTARKDGEKVDRGSHRNIDQIVPDRNAYLTEPDREPIDCCVPDGKSPDNDRNVPDRDYASQDGAVHSPDGDEGRAITCTRIETPTPDLSRSASRSPESVETGSVAPVTRLPAVQRISKHAVERFCDLVPGFTPVHAEARIRCLSETPLFVHRERQPDGKSPDGKRLAFLGVAVERPSRSDGRPAATPIHLVFLLVNGAMVTCGPAHFWSETLDCWTRLKAEAKDRAGRRETLLRELRSLVDDDPAAYEPTLTHFSKRSARPSGSLNPSPDAARPGAALPRSPR